MRWDGGVPAAERCCAAGDRASLPCPKMSFMPWESCGGEIKIEQDLGKVLQNV